MRNNIDKGRYGEDAARQYLEEKGYTILRTNYRTKIGEIDIIAAYQVCIIFVEVKYRNNLEKGLPREAVTKVKQQKIKKTAMWYIAEENISQTDFRFDVIEIIGGEALQITHLENAFW